MVTPKSMELGWYQVTEQGAMERPETSGGMKQPKGEGGAAQAPQAVGKQPQRHPQGRDWPKWGTHCYKWQKWGFKVFGGKGQELQSVPES